MPGWSSDLDGFEHWLSDRLSRNDPKPVRQSDLVTGLTSFVQTFEQIQQAVSMALGHQSTPGQDLVSLLSNQGDPPSNDGTSKGSSRAPGENRGGPRKASAAYPFDPKYFTSDQETEYFGQVTEYGTEMGNDYAMEPGTVLKSPFEGVIRTEDLGKKGWGKRVFVDLIDPKTKQKIGTTFAIGHMTGFAVHDGQQVGVGTVLGYSGGALGDPSSGVSSGPHIEVQYIDANGNYRDPDSLLHQIFEGKGSFAELSNSGALAGEGPSVPLTTSKYDQKPYMTSDGVAVYPNTPEADAFALANSVWKSVYGVDAPFYVVQSFMDSGIKTVQQAQSAMNSMPSPVDGLNLGQYDYLKKQANTLSNKYTGRPVPDSFIAEMHKMGRDTPALMDAWFWDKGFNTIKDKTAYQQVWDAANEFTRGTWKTAPHPETVLRTTTALTGGTTDGGLPPGTRLGEVRTEDDKTLGGGGASEPAPEAAVPDGGGGGGDFVP